MPLFERLEVDILLKIMKKIKEKEQNIYWKLGKTISQKAYHLEKALDNLFQLIMIYYLKENNLLKLLKI